MRTKRLAAVLWEWPNGTRFWACHDAIRDARVRDWPKAKPAGLGLKPVGAAIVVVAEGEGLDLVEQIQERTGERVRRFA